MNFSELLSNLSIHYNAFIRQVANSLSLTSSQAIHLISIPYNGTSMSKLARGLGLDTSTLTRNINKLEKLELVQKHADLNDQRIQIITLTNDGQKKVNIIEEKLTEIDNNLISQLNLEDQEELLDILEKLVWSMDCLRENKAI